MVSTATFHARVRGSVPGLGGLKETKMFLPHPRVKVSIVGSLRDREVACSASDRQGSNFESCVWRTVSSQSSHHPQEVLLAQFSLYVHKPDSFHFLHHHCRCWPTSMKHNLGLPTQYRFNVGPASQPIAGSMPGNRIRHWPNIETGLGNCPVLVLTAMRVTLYPPKAHCPYNTIHWPNCEIMLGHRPTETLWALYHEYNREYLFFIGLLKHEST